MEESGPKKLKKNRSDDRVSVHAMVESIVGCKWSLHVLAQVRDGINRPGMMVRTTRGLTTKVLNERLRKMVRFGIMEKVSYPEVPPRVEYTLTPFGRRFLRILDAIRELEGETQAEPSEGDSQNL